MSKVSILLNNNQHSKHTILLNNNQHSKHTILGNEDDDDDILNDDDDILNRMYKRLIVYKDITFLVMFIMQVLFVFVYAIYYYFNGFHVYIVNYNSSSIFGIILLSITTSIFISLLWAFFVSYFAKDFIKTSFSVTILASIVTGIGMFVSGYLLLGVFLMIFSGSILFLFIYMRPRIDFATTIIRIAIIAIKELPSLIIVTILTLLIQKNQ
jgi:cation transport ATPase